MNVQNTEARNVFRERSEQGVSAVPGSLGYLLVSSFLHACYLHHRKSKRRLGQENPKNLVSARKSSTSFAHLVQWLRAGPGLYC